MSECQLHAFIHTTYDLSSCLYYFLFDNLTRWRETYSEISIINFFFFTHDFSRWCVAETWNTCILHSITTTTVTFFCLKYLFIVKEKNRKERNTCTMYVFNTFWDYYYYYHHHRRRDCYSRIYYKIKYVVDIAYRILQSSEWVMFVKEGNKLFQLI